MNLAIRDHKIYQMVLELENRKKILCIKNNQLKQNSKNNDYLKEVLDDYKQYNDVIVTNKQKQIFVLEQLNNYIDKITEDLQLTSLKLKESNDEQREIGNEISIIKDELNNLINNDK